MHLRPHAAPDDILYKHTGDALNIGGSSAPTHSINIEVQCPRSFFDASIPPFIGLHFPLVSRLLLVYSVIISYGTA